MSALTHTPAVTMTKGQGWQDSKAPRCGKFGRLCKVHFSQTIEVGRDVSGTFGNIRNRGRRRRDWRKTRTTKKTLRRLETTRKGVTTKRGNDNKRFRREDETRGRGQLRLLATYDRDTYTSLHRDGDTVQKKHEPEESHPSRGMTCESRQSGITTESTVSGRRPETGTDHWLPGRGGRKSETVYQN